jgi:GNAT superfamily N-acetyltransferase
MLFLLDSNIAIKSDPLTPHVEVDASLAMEFHRLATSKHHDLRVHPSSLLDFDRIADPTARSARLLVFQKYEMLVSPPEINEHQRTILGSPVPGTNDAVDQDLLAAVVGDAVGYLVTEDQGLHRMARRVGVDDRVLLLADALAMLHGLYVTLPTPPPAVRRVKAHQLNLADPIFDSLRAAYDGFNVWFQEKAARTQRDALLIDGNGEHAAFCILKPEHAGEHGVAGPLLKLSTFKVAAGYSGQKYGELLLKAIFEQAHLEQMNGIYVTVFDMHDQLLGLLEDFGFERLAARTALNELIMVKHLRPTTEAHDEPLQHHIRYGPPSLLLSGVQPFLIPIEPRWHRVLFPDAEPVKEEGLFPESQGLVNQPFGNALRKAYLCNSPTRLLGPGCPLLFYRSQDEQAVFVIGVCEETLVSREAAEIAAHVGRRTVYTYEEIEGLTRRGDVLVVRFRQDRILRDDPITLDDLKQAGLARTWPQSIARTRPEGLTWLQQRLGV